MQSPFSITSSSSDCSSSRTPDFFFSPPVSSKVQQKDSPLSQVITVQTDSSGRDDDLFTPPTTVSPTSSVQSGKISLKLVTDLPQSLRVDHPIFPSSVSRGTIYSSPSNYGDEEDGNDGLVSKWSTLESRDGRDEEENPQEEGLSPDSSINPQIIISRARTAYTQGNQRRQLSALEIRCGGLGRSPCAPSAFSDLLSPQDPSDILKLFPLPPSTTHMHPDQLFPPSPLTQDCPHSPTSVLRHVKTAHELRLIEYLNCSDIRSDPWNPVVPLKAVVNPNNGGIDQSGGYEATLVLPFLEKVEEKGSFKTVEEAIVFMRQMLRGVVCLHDLGIAHLGIRQDIFMKHQSSSLRYFMVDFYSSLIVCNPNEYSETFTVDLHDCSRLIDSMFGEAVPEIRPLLSEMESAQVEKKMTSHDVLARFEGIVRKLSKERVKGAL